MAVRPVRQIVLVERYLGQATAPRLSELAAANEAAVRSAGAMPATVIYLGSVLIPADETCFCVYAADSVTAVARLTESPLAPALRVVDGLVVAWATGHPGRTSRHGELTD
jgi:hypothetical protein